MEFHQISPLPSQRQTHFVMTSVSPKLRHKLFHLRFLCTSSSSSSPIYIPEIPSRPSTLRRTVRAKVSDAQLKENWLASLSCPFPQDKENLAGVNEELNAGSEWILGVDPDVSGALALLKTEDCCCSAQIYDSPHLQVLIGRKVRRRLDAKSIVQLLHNLDAPHGTTAYIEQSNPFPQDGKQGWWSGGFGYGLWIGVLVALGFSVVPVSSLTWKNTFELSGSNSSKDDSRRVASELFPSLSPMLKRKKDHGRAEALLIAAYGKGLKLNSGS